MQSSDTRKPDAYFVTEGARSMVDPSAGFSTRAYLTEYPDIASNRINAFRHYANHGRSEGRRAFGANRVRVTAGRRALRANLPTIVVCCHEASRTGAPLVGLNLVRELCSEFNVVAMLMRGGVLAELFSEFSIASVITGGGPGEIEVAAERVARDFSPSCAVLNSMETTKFAAPLARFGIGLVSLIHEFAQYVQPIGTTASAICLSDRVIFPADLVRDSALLELRRLGFDLTPSNIRVRNQGRSIVPLVQREEHEVADVAQLIGSDTDGNRPFVVLGAGWVQMRKGLDLFIEAARVLKHDLGVDCRFIWVGANYKPFEDMGLSVYLADQIIKSGLEDVVIMVEEQASLARFWDAADAFFMSSRLDPFPNVALDAIAEGMPVLCFKGGCGIAEIAEQWPDHVKAITYGDARGAALEMREIAKSRQSLDLPDGLKDLLSFSRYAKDLAGEIRGVIASAPEREAQVASLVSSGEFDAALFTRSAPPWLGRSVFGPGPLVKEIADKAVRAGRAGVPLAFLRPDRLNLPQPDDGWRQPSHVALRRGHADRVPKILLATDEPARIEALARRAYANPEGFQVHIVTKELRGADFDVLKSVLNPAAVSITRLPTDVNTAADAIADWLGDGPFECDRSRAGDEDQPPVDVATLFEDYSDLLLIVQPARHAVDYRVPPTPAGLSDPALPPRGLVDSRTAWIRTSDARVRKAVAHELIKTLDPRAAPSDWMAIVAQAAGDLRDRWAILRDEEEPRRGYSILYGL
ncbi:Glycosyl transferases group 1 [Caulobacter sp. UNC279MFTsu5.1]|nr:Glycosyl transferases group 1 [Caulobacter sp. UNC279MFTsu5.1]